MREIKRNLVYIISSPNELHNLFKKDTRRAKQIELWGKVEKKNERRKIFMSRLNSLFNQHQHATSQLIKHRKEYSESGKESLAIHGNILQFENDISSLRDQIETNKNKINFENYKLASVEKVVSANSSIIEYICADLARISKDIEVRANCI